MKSQIKNQKFIKRKRKGFLVAAYISELLMKKIVDYANKEERTISYIIEQALMEKFKCPAKYKMIRIKGLQK